MNKKQTKVGTTFSFIERLLTLAFAVTWCVSISAFAFLAGIPFGITSTAVRIKICAITAGIKKYKLILR